MLTLAFIIIVVVMWENIRYGSKAKLHHYCENICRNQIENINKTQQVPNHLISTKFVCSAYFSILKCFDEKQGDIGPRNALLNLYMK